MCPRQKPALGTDLLRELQSLLVTARDEGEQNDALLPCAQQQWGTMALPSALFLLKAGLRCCLPCRAALSAAVLLCPAAWRRPRRKRSLAPTPAGGVCWAGSPAPHASARTYIYLHFLLVTSEKQEPGEEARRLLI